jgi:FkbM family methyltransferase
VELNLISYAQRYEDVHLMRIFGDKPSGFYIDVGAGHPVYDNVSFAFYLRGWRGVSVEPNAWLAQLSEAVRPRDTHVQALVGNAPGEASYYLVEHFHGLSTTIEKHARSAQAKLGRPFQTMTMPVMTLKMLCESHVPAEIDFLKIDVEGAERTVIEGADWLRFRPKIVVAEAIEPITIQPSWEDWDAILTDSHFRFIFFDGLNRYYVGDEHTALADRLAASSERTPDVAKFCDFKPALEDELHPDHALAELLKDMDMVRLPLAPRKLVVGRLLKGLDAGDLDRRANTGDAANAHLRLFGTPGTTDWKNELGLKATATVRDLYWAAAASNEFCVACGRISASCAW